ncbi:AAA family ATPase [Shewanella glacialimarina]|nr:AAA family ATPase [Shewanella glacialimarina]
MRMPNARQISEEQQDVFEDAPISGSVMVSGPPGTGKTVIAFLRAQALSRKKITAVVLMYNRVLRSYTQNIAAEIDGDVNSKTMHSWLPEWWKLHCIEREADDSEATSKSDKVFLNNPFSDKDEVKAAGGRFDRVLKKWFVNRDVYEADSKLFSKWPEFIPILQAQDKIYLKPCYEERVEVKAAGANFDQQKKRWFITKQQLDDNFERFERWLGFGGKFDPPELKKWHYDWELMLDQYLELDSDKFIDWGHLIIDEAQDFPPDFFKFLLGASRCMINGGITILADENQRLHDGQNSSLEDIRKCLKIKKENEFRLTQNFRNTKPIALLAQYFYVGLPTGTPDIPEKTGDKPKLVAVKEQLQQVMYIKNYLKFRGAQEVAIVVDSDDDRRFYFDKLIAELPNYKVQTYSSFDPKTSETLKFDEQGVITILNRRSCKGLEFDTVFIPELQNFSFSDTELVTFQMNMYVVCSRARSELVLMYLKDEKSKAPILEHLPSEGSGLMEYREI